MVFNRRVEPNAKTRCLAAGVALVGFLALLAAATGCSPQEAADGQPPVPTAAPAASVLPAPPTRPTRPYSVQLHVHGSFSEGIASMDSHSWEATGVGAEVIWWSDHDFRITSYAHAATFGFEDWKESIAHSPSWRRQRKRPAGRDGRQPGALFVGITPLPSPPDAPGSAEFTDARPDEGARSLRLELTGDSPEFRPYRFEIAADRGLLKRPLASKVALELSILPERIGPDARALVEVELSEHAPHGDLPLATHRLRYVLGDGDGPARRTGNTYAVPLAAKAGEWNRYRLAVTEDAIQGFPWTPGEDNSLVAIVVGVEARRNATASAHFDRLVIRQEISGLPAFATQARTIAAIAKRYPQLTELQGVEISYAGHHLNEFSVATELLDYDRVLPELAKAADESADGRRVPDLLAEYAVREAHRRDGLVSYNHMFGAGLQDSSPTVTRDEVLARLVETRLFGADILEVGYRDRGGRSLADHLWVWDQVARAGLFPVGVGVSDSHGGVTQRWREGPNNFLSWIHATGPSKAELLEGLRAGRVFFGDIVRFQGAIDLSTADGFRMGQVVLSDAAEAVVTVTVDGASQGDRIAVVQSGEVVASFGVKEAKAAKVEHTVRARLHATEPTVIRVEVADAAGVKAASNPIVLVRAIPEEGLPRGRAALRAFGATSTDIRGMTVASVSRRDGVLRICGRARGGALTLALAQPAGEATLEELAGRWSATAPGMLSFEGLEGDGCIAVPAG